jgi:mannan polymerase II complex ANP1 subunit
MEIDGVGGVSILAKARVFRAGAHFPAFSFEKHAETEGFGKVCAFLSFTLIFWGGLKVWIIDGKTAEVFCCWPPTLHSLASL